MEISRRFFLGGAISLAAVVTFEPSVSAMMNLPTIYGNGKDDDTGGLAALFRNEPATFNKEQIGVEGHGGICFHHGRFVISRAIDIPEELNLKVDAANFIYRDLGLTEPFFRCINCSTDVIYNATDGNLKCIFEVPSAYNGKVAISTKPIEWPRNLGRKYY